MIGRVAGIVLPLLRRMAEGGCFEAFFGNGLNNTDGAGVCKAFPNDSMRFGQKIVGHQIQCLLGIVCVILHKAHRVGAGEQHPRISIGSCERRIGIELFNDGEFFKPGDGSVTQEDFALSESQQCGAPLPTVHRDIRDFDDAFCGRSWLDREDAGIACEFAD